MEISKYLRDTSRTIEGKQQLMMGAFAKALEIIPRQICDNAGIDATDVLNKLRMLHAQGETWAGVDVEAEGVGNSMERFVIEPSIVKINALEGACEAACLVLSVDETVTNPQSAAVRSFSFRFSTTFSLISSVTPTATIWTSSSSSCSTSCARKGTGTIENMFKKEEMSLAWRIMFQFSLAVEIIDIIQLYKMCDMQCDKVK
jgi:hypothetical protein